MRLDSAGLGVVKDLSIVAAGVVGFFTLWTALAQYARSLHSARASQFVAMRRRFLEDRTFRRLLDRLAAGDEGIAEESVQDRRNLAGFLEEVALMVNSGLLRYDVARAMFGYYVRLVGASEEFWRGLDRDADSWAIFRAFERRLASGEAMPPVSRLRL